MIRYSLISIMLMRISAVKVAEDLVQQDDVAEEKHHWDDWDDDWSDWEDDWSDWEEEELPQCSADDPAQWLPETSTDIENPEAGRACDSDDEDNNF